jgi:hypothetical protein
MDYLDARFTVVRVGAPCGRPESRAIEDVGKGKLGPGGNVLTFNACQIEGLLLTGITV